MQLTEVLKIRISPELLDRLDQFIEDFGVGDRSGHARKALEEYIERYDQHKPGPAPLSTVAKSEGES